MGRGLTRLANRRIIVTIGIIIAGYIVTAILAIDFLPDKQSEQG